MFETYLTTICGVLTALWMRDKYNTWKENRRYGADILGRW